MKLTVKLPEGTPPNALLKAILPTFEIRGFREILPSMNDIFYRTSKQKPGKQTQIKMNKIALIIKREYWTRVRKTSFVVMSMLGPLLMAA